MAMQHEVVHFNADSPTATGQEKVKGLKTGDWGILGGKT